MNSRARLRVTNIEGPTMCSHAIMHALKATARWVRVTGQSNPIVPDIDEQVVAASVPAAL